MEPTPEYPDDQIQAAADYEQTIDVSELAAALCKAQGQLHAASKDAKNSHFGSTYTTLSSVIDAYRQPLADNGLSVLQAPTSEGTTHVALTTTLFHESGQWVRCVSRIPMKPTLLAKWKQPKEGDENYGTLLYEPIGPHEMGSAITYLRRYSLSSLLGIAQTDDDGDAAQKADRVEEPEPEPRKKRAPRKVKVKDPAEEGEKLLAKRRVALKEAFTKLNVDLEELTVILDCPDLNKATFDHIEVAQGWHRRLRSLESGVSDEAKSEWRDKISAAEAL